MQSSRSRARLRLDCPEHYFFFEVLFFDAFFLVALFPDEVVMMIKCLTRSLASVLVLLLLAGCASAPLEYPKSESKYGYMKKE